MYSEIKFIGTCSGTEPFPGLYHTCFVIKTPDGSVYWFDAGEGCAHNAHVSGVDLLSVRAVFISHTHMDHIGGLGGLFWNIRKLCSRRGEDLPRGTIPLYVPEPRAWEGIQTMLGCTEGGFSGYFTVDAHPVSDGLLYHDENITVTAFHNHHLQAEEGDGWRSFSYRIELAAARKTVVFSGDVRTPGDLDAAVGDGCDLLLMETGHHSLASVSEYVSTHPVESVSFLHHGREILNDPSGAEEKVRRFSVPAAIRYEGDTIIF